jgi:hypothetical protein
VIVMEDPARQAEKGRAMQGRAGVDRQGGARQIGRARHAGQGKAFSAGQGTTGR